MSRRSLAALLLLLGTVPIQGTIWTRSTNVIKVPRGSKEPLSNVMYSTREWNVAVSAVEVRDDPAPADLALPRWIFYYRNTDSQPHYVLITVQCQDVHRKDRARFSYTGTLAPDHKEDVTLELASKVKTDEWRQTLFVRITFDFLSTPTG